MNKTVKRFGEIVTNNVASRPGRAARLLRAGFAFTGFKARRFPDKRLPDSKKYSAIKSMEALLKPLKEPDHSAIVNIFLPCEMLHVMGIRPLVAEQVSCYMTGAASEQAMIKAAVEAGVPESQCSYHKILSGSAVSGILGKPRFIANTTMVCDANINTFRFLADHYDVPHIIIDTPASDEDAAVEYVARQLRDMAGQLEDIMGEKMDQTALKRACDCADMSLAYYKKALQVLKNRYLPTTMTSEMYNLLMIHNLLGKKSTEKYFKLLLKDCRNAKRYIGGSRIMWFHTMPNCQDTMREIFDFNEDHQLLISDLTIDALNVKNHKDPYMNMAARILGNVVNGTFEKRAQNAIKAARSLNATGMIFFGHWGCRNTLGGMRIMESLAEEAGLPLLILDGDGCDFSNINQGQMATKVEAFMEIMEKKI